MSMCPRNDEKCTRSVFNFKNSTKLRIRLRNIQRISKDWPKSIKVGDMSSTCATTFRNTQATVVQSRALCPT